MSVKQTIPDLADVEETLLIPLYMRAKETLRPDAICGDPKAVQVVSRLDYDFERFDRHGDSMQLDIAVRTEILDEVVGDILSHKPNAVVINLGAGLDGRFQRLDNGLATWLELDLPEVIALRRRFYRETLRNPFLPMSALDPRWFDLLDRGPDQPIVVLAEGLLPYLEPAAVWNLFDQIAERLAGADVVFQSMSPDLVHQEHHVPAVNQTRAKFEWGIRSGREVCERDPRYARVGEWHYIDRHIDRWQPVLRRWWYLPNLRQQMREIMKISHLRIAARSVVTGGN